VRWAGGGQEEREGDGRGLLYRARGSSSHRSLAITQHERNPTSCAGRRANPDGAKCQRAFLHHAMFVLSPPAAIPPARASHDIAAPALARPKSGHDARPRNNPRTTAGPSAPGNGYRVVRREQPLAVHRLAVRCRQEERWILTPGARRPLNRRPDHSPAPRASATTEQTAYRLAPTRMMHRVGIRSQLPWPDAHRVRLAPATARPAQACILILATPPIRTRRIGVAVEIVGSGSSEHRTQRRRTGRAHVERRSRRATVHVSAGSATSWRWWREHRRQPGRGRMSPSSADGATEWRPLG
jgi:hypothetical protein